MNVQLGLCVFNRRFGLQFLGITFRIAELDAINQYKLQKAILTETPTKVTKKTGEEILVVSHKVNLETRSHPILFAIFSPDQPSRNVVIETDESGQVELAKMTRFTSSVVKQFQESILEGQNARQALETVQQSLNRFNLLMDEENFENNQRSLDFF